MELTRGKTKLNEIGKCGVLIIYLLIHTKNNPHCKYTKHSASQVGPVSVEGGGLGGVGWWWFWRRVFSAGQCSYLSSIGQECQISQAAALLQASTAAPPVSLLPSAPRYTTPALLLRPAARLLPQWNFCYCNIHLHREYLWHPHVATFKYAARKV